MKNKNEIIGNNNIVIQGVADSVITITVDGEIKEIHNELAALRELLEQQQNASFQVADKTYNIDEITEANFGGIVRKRAFNMFLTRNLIDQLAPHNKDIRTFKNNIASKNKDNWELERVYEQHAKKHIVGSFIWVIARELERLFRIGTIASDDRIDNYIEHALRTYKLTLQIVNYALLAQLWQHKKESPTSPITDEAISNLFSSELELRHDECLAIFQSLLAIYDEEGLALPIPELKVLNNKPTEKAALLDACEQLHQIKTIFYQGTHLLHHCFEAEKQLTTVLTAFKFLANYRMVSMKKIELGQFPNSDKPRYIKDFNILGRMKKRTIKDKYERRVSYSKEASSTYAVFLKNNKAAINLFPFVLDFNALTGEDGSSIYCYEHRVGQNGLVYFFIDGDRNEEIYYKAIISGKDEDIKLKAEDQKNFKLDIALLQFQEAQNTILGTNHHFELLEDDSDWDM